MKRQIFIFVVCLVIAFGLRCYKLGDHSYRGTEVGTISVASTSIIKLFAADLRCPFFRLILHGWMNLLSKEVHLQKEFATRLLSVIFGALAIIPLYYLTKSLIDKKVAIISAYLATISPFYILISRTAEDFTLSLLLVALSLLLFLHWCEEGKGLPWYIIATILMLYSGPLLFLVLIGEWIYFGLRWQSTKERLKLWLIGQVLIFILYSYGIVHFFQVFSGEYQAFDRLPVSSVLLKAIYAFYTFSVGETVLPWNWKIVLPAGYIYAGISAFGLTKIKRKYRSLSFIILFLLLPIVPIFTNRGAPEYCICTSIAYYILLAIGISAMRPPISIPILVAITFFNVYSLTNLYTDKEYHNQSFTDNWRLITKYVEEECKNEKLKVKSVKLDVGADTSLRGGVELRPYIVAYHGSFIWYYKEVQPHGDNLIVLDTRNPEFTEAKLMSTNKVLFVHTPGSGVFSSDDRGIYKFKEWLDQNFLCTHTVGFFENEDYEIKRKLLKRTFPRFRVQVFTYERGNISRRRILG